jgi:hypothetical protein
MLEQLEMFSPPSPDLGRRALEIAGAACPPPKVVRWDGSRSCYACRIVCLGVCAASQVGGVCEIGTVVKGVWNVGS